MFNGSGCFLMSSYVLLPSCQSYHTCHIQSQIQDFPKEGARFRVKCHVDAIQWGGG